MNLEACIVIEELKNKNKSIAVIGLGYVGLPLALQFAKYYHVIGFDINSKRIEDLQNAIDITNEITPAEFEDKDILFTSEINDLKRASFYIIAVLTPVDEFKVPDLSSLKKASESVGQYLSKGDYVVYESTVYPGCTEEDCIPILEEESGLKAGEEFSFGYSPERVVPGEKHRTIEKITKVVSGNSEESLRVIAGVYGQIIEAGVYKAPSIKVAEASKAIENTQRDLNISLMNELAMVFDKMDIDTKEVIKAASTKWNFMKFYPGLVGGHCIGVDPYYLIYKAKQKGYDPQVILSGRRINNQMPSFIAKKLIQFLIQGGKNPSDCSVLVMGVTFKENVADIRNSKVMDLVKELTDYSVNVQVVDPYAIPGEVEEEYGLILEKEIGSNYDAVIVAVAHKEYAALDISYFESICTTNPILMDIKGTYAKSTSLTLKHWRL